MREAVRLPQWGMGMTEATVLAWHKQVGDEVGEDEPIATIEAAKAETEFGSPYAGRIVEIAAAADTTVAVGEVLAWIETAD